jgi:hypothetical protein
MEKKMYKTREGVELPNYQFTDRDIEEANSINVLDLARKMGYEVKDDHRLKWARVKDQGGLTIDKDKNRWYCHNTKQGGGPIQLVMYMQGLKWKEAVVELLGNSVLYSKHLNDYSIPEPSKADFKPPEKNSTYKHMFAYLVKSRKIHPDVVNYFVKKKLIYENTKQSCVFVGTNKEGEPKYANIRSTNTVGNAFKGDASLSDKRFGFAKGGTDNVLVVTEAPIDLLSYMSIFKNHGLYHMIENNHLLSLGGVSDTALIQYLEDHPEINKIKLALDNDAAGNEACKLIYQRLSSSYSIERIQMKGKDMNDTLIQDLENQKIKEKMNQLQASTVNHEEELEPA